ncbi:hypothetical protein [Planktothrix sp. FACHB-1365]|uniref:hypothetical protein n=1 Tax=Planktothrix sp. FACHB-1365 TaxID=2692855 RepID=UPI0016878E5D|nr:hypothetical protein [Planktothrix sp. FACHB-1365]MBD2481165.1 hypothetical protein [Planktothrix sp. FACHB-1365]
MGVTTVYGLKSSGFILLSLFFIVELKYQKLLILMNILPDKTVNIEFKNAISPKKKQQNINKNQESLNPHLQKYVLS